MIRLLLLVFFSASQLLVQDNKDLLPWSGSQRLVWEDFRGLPPEHSKNAASTSSGIVINFNYSAKTFKYTIACHFNRLKSWGRVKNDHVLSHEQGHFDITELYARKLNKRLKEYRFHASTVSKDVNDIYQEVVAELQVTQNAYDSETDYSRNMFQQKNWLGKIQNELTSFEDYANYSGK